MAKPATSFCVSFAFGEPFAISPFTSAISRLPFAVSRLPFAVSHLPSHVSRFPFAVRSFPIPKSHIYVIDSSLENCYLSLPIIKTTIQKTFPERICPIEVLLHCFHAYPHTNDWGNGTGYCPQHRRRAEIYERCCHQSLARQSVGNVDRWEMCRIGLSSKI
jgi:hypothetical protein